MSWNNYYDLRNKKRPSGKHVKCVECQMKYEVSSSTDMKDYRCWSCRRNKHLGSDTDRVVDLASLAKTRGSPGTHSRN